MSCKARGCMFPAQGNGYCQAHQWMDPASKIDHGLSMHSSLGSSPRATEQNIPAQPTPHRNFQPRITIGPSKMTAGAKVFVLHWPGGSEETYGVVGKMSLDIATATYIKQLRVRFKVTAEEDQIDRPDAPPLETPDEVPQAPPTVTVEPPKTQPARALEALQKGAETAAQVAEMTGFSPSTASAALSQLQTKRMIEKIGTTDGRICRWRIVGTAATATAEPQATSAPQDKKCWEVVHDWFKLNPSAVIRPAALSKIVNRNQATVISALDSHLGLFFRQPDGLYRLGKKGDPSPMGLQLADEAERVSHCLPANEPQADPDPDSKPDTVEPETEEQPGITETVIPKEQTIINHLVHVRLDSDGEVMASLRGNPFFYTDRDRKFVFDLLNLIGTYQKEKP